MTPGEQLAAHQLNAQILWGEFMKSLIRASIVALTALLLVGCANDSGNVLTGLAPVSPAYAAGLGAEPSQDPSKKTLVSKMLTAIALERVTGRKPDPSRLSEL